MEDINKSSVELEDEEISQEENNENISLSSEEENYNGHFLNQNKNKFNIGFEYEVYYWKNYFIKKYAYIPSECPQCKHKNIILGKIII